MSKNRGMPSEFVSEMEALTYRTYKDRRERAFSICLENGKLVKSEPSIGTKRGIDIPLCEGKFVGYFHTHPYPSEEFSVGDTHFTLTKELQMQCVGAVVRPGEMKPRYPELRVKCMCINTGHPQYQKYKQHIMEVSGELSEIEAEMIKSLLEKGELPRTEIMEKGENLRKIFTERMEKAERANVVTEKLIVRKEIIKPVYSAVPV